MLFDKLLELNVVSFRMSTGIFKIVGTLQFIGYQRGMT